MHENPSAVGCLYIVPTPIGNLADMSERALQVLAEVDLIAAEDTRHSGQLLQHFALHKPMFALHEHNERQRAATLISKLQEGQSIALVSDAGTPLISDPGYVIVQACREAGIRVVPLPGACALITALSAAGLPTDRFCFEGFLPAKPQQRRNALNALKVEPRTLVFYESPHRIVATLADLGQCFGAERHVVLARELTKQYETFLVGSVAEVAAKLAADPNQQRGEMVIVVAGAQAQTDAEQELNQALQTVQLLRAELPLKKACALAAEIHGLRKNQLYQLALEQ